MSDLQHGPRDEYEDDGFDDGPIYDEGRRRLSPLAKTLVIAAICVASVALAGLVWFAYNQGVRSGSEETAPVLRADTAPVKRKPDDPGGMQIPNQDKLVYQRIAPGQAQQPVERLLPPPEQPVERPQPAAPAPDASAPPAPSETEAIDKAAPSAGGGSIAQAIRQATNEAIAAKDTGDGQKPFERAAATADHDAAKAADTKAGETMEKPAMTAEAPKVAPPPPPAPKPVQQAAVPPAGSEPAKPAGPAWRVQLASLTSEAKARAAWERMQKANSDLLGALALNVQKAELSKGTFYRIQAGPLADRAAASDLCGKLKSRKQDCLVVAP